MKRNFVILSLLLYCIGCGLLPEEITKSPEDNAREVCDLMNKSLNPDGLVEFISYAQQYAEKDSICKLIYAEGTEQRKRYDAIIETCATVEVLSKVKDLLTGDDDESNSIAEQRTSSRTETECRVRIIDLECISTASDFGNKDEIRIYIDGSRVGDKYKMDDGDVVSVSETASFTGSATLSIEEVDSFNNDEIDEKTITCDDTGVNELTFSGEGGEYVLRYQIVE
jgi:hypothetical protein